MKNIIKIFWVMCLLIFCSSQSYARNIFSADLQSKRIAEGTIMQLQFPQGLNTLQNTQGDYFTAILKNDIKLNRKTVLPAGSILRGSVESIKKSRRLKIPAQMYLDFDHIVMPDGRQIDVDFRLTGLTLTPDGMGLSGGGNYCSAVAEGFEDSVDMVKNAVDWGNEQGDKFLGGYPKLIITPVSAIGAGCVGTVGFMGKTVGYLFMKGNEVCIMPNQIISGCLTTPLDIPFR